MDIADLIAERDIRTGYALYARSLDDHDWPSLVGVLAPDVESYFGPKGAQEVFKGLDALIANSQKFLKSCGPTQHLIGAIEVTVRGDRASSRGQTRVLQRGRDEQAELFLEAFGDYLAEWRRTKVGWRAVRWEFRTTMSLGTPAVFRLG